MSDHSFEYSFDSCASLPCDKDDATFSREKVKQQTQMLHSCLVHLSTALQDVPANDKDVWDRLLLDLLKLRTSVDCLLITDSVSKKIAAENLVTGVLDRVSDFQESKMPCLNQGSSDYTDYCRVMDRLDTRLRCSIFEVNMAADIIQEAQKKSQEQENLH